MNTRSEAAAVRNGSGLIALKQVPWSEVEGDDSEAVKTENAMKAAKAAEQLKTWGDVEDDGWVNSETLRSARRAMDREAKEFQRYGHYLKRLRATRQRHELKVWNQMTFLGVATTLNQLKALAKGWKCIEGFRMKGDKHCETVRVRGDAITVN